MFTKPTGLSFTVFSLTITTKSEREREREKLGKVKSQEG